MPSTLYSTLLGFSNPTAEESLTDSLNTLNFAERETQPNVSLSSPELGGSNGTISEVKAVEIDKGPVDETIGIGIGNGTQTAPAGKQNDVLNKLLENFTVDDSTYALAQFRATFYPKFENANSDLKDRNRAIEMVSKGLAILEVSLKHSGSLFMYAGPHGGAYTKNSYGTKYTAVGLFVLERTFCEAWGPQASKIQAEFNEFLELNRMCISMELVTAVLEDHGKRPHEDYVVVTAVTELGGGKPKFYSTPDIIAFCRKWRLPTNHVWLFSTRDSVMSFFGAYDSLYEEGTATLICKALDDVADISVPGSKDHVKVQGEILEGLVARTVGPESLILMEQVLRDYPPTVLVGADHHLRRLREIDAANRTNEKQLIKELLDSVGTSFCPNYLDGFGNEASDSDSRVDWLALSKFLQARPADFSTMKLQEIVHLMKKKYAAAFKCYHNFHKINSVARDNLYFKMVIHVRHDSTFSSYREKMRCKPGLWPLYRGFFVDLNIFKANKERALEFSKEVNATVETGSDTNVSSAKDGLADEDANLMIKLKFLPYKIRTFLIRDGLKELKKGEDEYKSYYMRQMQKWNISGAKERELCKMLEEWAVHMRRHKQLSESKYLSEAEPFLEQYANRSPQNLALIGSAGSLVRTEDFLTIVEGGRDEEGDLEPERETTLSNSSPMVKEAIRKDEGLIVFFPGIPGCAKSALCKEILGSSGGLGDDRPIHSLMGDLIKGNYWGKVAEERRKKPYSIILADKNAPNKEVWRQIENMCCSTKALAIPVVPDSEGTESNPFSLDALAVFIFRVLNRVNHPGNLDKSKPNAGYILLMFYHLYNGKSRKEFESELIECFGSLVKMPLLIFERWDSSKGIYIKEWAKWEEQLRGTLLENAEYFNSIQVPLDFSVQKVLEQIKAIATEKQRFGSIVFVAITLSVSEILGLLDDLGTKDQIVEDFLKTSNLKSSLTKAHVTLAHKRSHGVTSIASYGPYLHQKVAISMNVLLFSDKLAALGADPILRLADGEEISSKNEWPHLTLWTAQGVAAKEASMLPKLFTQGKATRVEIDPPITITGTLEFY
ncbi:hypothetical protein RD792_000816 [Penstemon davidsonii]|uniref:Uncharacterized protein n=1 Tax=Penstemon davidsonii TaxID=160366 RepID=A0ABR0DLR7_9LAMI|nr:hypothetical protein RD792_000816 [Penstemon davidsonii]